MRWPDGIASKDPTRLRANAVCGIFGYLGEALAPAVLERAAKSLTHRGRDAFGSFSDADGRVYLGHCRLSILDLSDRATQPMVSPDGRYQIVYNGEIYNFPALRAELQSRGRQFMTTGDTEVLLAAYAEWGRECLSRLTGMFAFGIWDRVDRKLFLARDRLGIKPLYVDRRSGRLAFASEARALLQLPGERRVAPRALVTYLRNSYVVGRPSIWQGISRLGPGEWLEYQLETEKEERGRYWSLPSQPREQTLEAARDELESLLSRAAREHFVADVPVGVLLSGGLDSGLVASASAASQAGVRSYSIGFDGWARSETAQAEETARHLGLRSEQYVVSGQDRSRIEEVLAHFDEPLADTAIVPTDAVCRTARRHVKVALSGDGGDELFGGYTWYAHLVRQPWRRQLSFLYQGFRRSVGLGRNWPDASGDFAEYHRFLTCPSFRTAEVREFFPWLSPEDVEAAADLPEVPRNSPTPLSGWRAMDVENYLVDNNLMRVDRLSMAHGLEVRVPLLDHRLVEFAFSLPDELCVSAQETKVLLRSLARKRLPAAVAEKQKQGFSFPLQSLWPVDDMLTRVRTGAMAADDFVSTKAVDRLMSSPRPDNWNLKVWLLLVLEAWYAEWAR